jgi:RNA polymerase sigma-70 factor, ECF subfamily
MTIARGLARRDPDILDQLIEEYQHRLFRYLVFLTGQPALAEDLFQETWLRVLERGQQYDGRSPFVAWLIAIARNLATDHLRRKQPQSLDALIDDSQNEPPAAEFDQPAAAFDLVAARECREQLDHQIAGLPAIHREVLLLRFQEEMSLEDIAAAISVPVPTVKSRLYRALASLAERMREAQ